MQTRSKEASSPLHRHCRPRCRRCALDCASRAQKVPAGSLLRGLFASHLCPLLASPLSLLRVAGAREAEQARPTAGANHFCGLDSKMKERQEMPTRASATSQQHLPYTLHLFPPFSPSPARHQHTRHSASAPWEKTTTASSASAAMRATLRSKRPTRSLPSRCVRRRRRPCPLPALPASAERLGAQRHCACLLAAPLHCYRQSGRRRADRLSAGHVSLPATLRSAPLRSLSRAAHCYRVSPHHMLRRAVPPRPQQGGQREGALPGGLRGLRCTLRLHHRPVTQCALRCAC